MKDSWSLKKVFATGATPTPAEMRGHFAVRLVTGLLPEVRFFGHRKFFPESVEYSGGGYNEFLGSLRVGDFRIEVGPSVLGDGENILRINYNRPGNPFWLRPLNDELKRIREGYYLGRGVYALGGRAFKVMYFSLERLAE
ncbi:MAG: hypothetical protein PHY31_01545 [Smithellaceae bacterium]|nr:hypothetical protein [Smithellaceae bacterium]